ncbi:MAG: protein kinase, partial [Thermoanaerobaculia bacterium]
MSADPRLPDLFAEISDLATSERRERLGELAATDPALARELAELIEAGESYPDRLVPGELAQLDGLEAIGERALPAAIGEFRILRELGRGGMGRVYLAEQETSTYRRRVALKLLESSTLDPQAVKRFRDEVRILASLEHPGIARFLDGGQTADGTWFLALEFVEGEDLVADARRRALSIDQRVRLFATVLEAVAYAHERRVIHRDLKPGNILVGADGRPKLLDFGISKLIDPGSVGDATSTRTELRAFTPAYASPEQFRGEPATPASDVYSAGVLLYELLTGVRPFGRRSGSPDAAARFERAVLEEDPEPPSTAARRATRELTTRNTWELMTKAGATGAQLSPDLDAICLKALRKDAAARYRSAAEFAGDLERYLDQRPVLAREGLRRYRLERFLHRNRRGLLTTAAFVLTLAVALTAIVVAVRGAERTHAVAVEPAPRPFPFSPAKAPKVEDAERDFVAAPQSVEAGAAYALGLQRAGRFKEAAVVVARLRQIPGRENDPLIDYVDALLATGAIQSQRALILLERALASAIAGGRGELVAQVRATRGRLLSTMGRRDEARSDMELARSAFEAAGDQTSLARVLNDLAIEAAQEGDLGKAEELFEAALAASGGNRGAALLNNLANLAMLRGRPDLAKGRFDESIPIARESGRPSRLGFALRELSLALRDLGRPGEAD